jgi:hypothetical protein
MQPRLPYRRSSGNLNAPPEHPIRIRVYDHHRGAVNVTVGLSQLVQIYPSSPWPVAVTILCRAHKAVVAQLSSADARESHCYHFLLSRAPARSGSSDSEEGDVHDDVSDARIFLLPGGEEITSLAMLRENDSVCVHRGTVLPPPAKTAQEMERAKVAEEVSPLAATGPPPKGKKRRSSIDIGALKRENLHKGDSGNDANVERVMDEILQSVIPRRGGARRRMARDDPKKRFKRAVQRVIFINRFGGGSPKRSAITKESTRRLGPAIADDTSTDWGSVRASSVVGRGRDTKRSTVGKSVDAYIKNLVDLYKYSQNRVIDDEVNKEKLPWNVLHPDSAFKSLWDVMTLSFVVYFAFVVPIRIGFDLDLSPAEAAFDFVADIIFLIDIVISSRTAFKEDGIMVFSTSRMCQRYTSTWFAMDFLASFPIGWFVSGAESRVNILFRMLRLFKLFRILRLLKLFPRIISIIESYVKFNPSLLRFLRSFVVLIIIWHTIGCLYFFVAREEYGGVVDCLAAEVAQPGDPVGEGKCFINYCICKGGYDPVDIQVLNETKRGWLDQRNPDMWVPHYTIASAQLDEQYWLSFFWAVQVTTGIGADIKPKSVPEFVFTSVVAMVGLMVYAVIIGSASSALQNMDMDAANRRQILEAATSFMRSRKVPMFFQKIIKDFYDHLWESPREVNDVFADLPPTLRARLSIVMNRDLIDRIPVLQMIPIDVYIRTVQRFQKSTFLPGEYIIRQGDAGDTLLFIDRGRVDAVLPNGRTVFMTLFPGDFFGESSLLYGTLRDASFRAVDFVDLFIMDQSTFDEVSVMAPDFINEIRRTDADRQGSRLRAELQAADPVHYQEPERPALLPLSQPVQALKSFITGKPAKPKARIAPIPTIIGAEPSIKGPSVQAASKQALRSHPELDLGSTSPVPDGGRRSSRALFKGSDEKVVPFSWVQRDDVLSRESLSHAASFGRDSPHSSHSPHAGLPHQLTFPTVGERAQATASRASVSQARVLPSDAPATRARRSTPRGDPSQPTARSEEPTRDAPPSPPHRSQPAPPPRREPGEQSLQRADELLHTATQIQQQNASIDSLPSASLEEEVADLFLRALRRRA